MPAFPYRGCDGTKIHKLQSHDEKVAFYDEEVKRFWRSKGFHEKLLDWVALFYLTDFKGRPGIFPGTRVWEKTPEEKRKEEENKRAWALWRQTVWETILKKKAYLQKAILDKIRREMAIEALLENGPISIW
jgi:hypothetical protein